MTITIAIVIHHMRNMTNQLEYCNISDEEPQLGCSHDLGQARKIDLARERIKACEAERNRV